MEVFAVEDSYADAHELVAYRLFMTYEAALEDAGNRAEMEWKEEMSWVNKIETPIVEPRIAIDGGDLAADVISRIVVYGWEATPMLTMIIRKVQVGE